MTSAREKSEFKIKDFSFRKEPTCSTTACRLGLSKSVIAIKTCGTLRRSIQNGGIQAPFFWTPRLSGWRKNRLLRASSVRRRPRCRSTISWIASPDMIRRLRITFSRNQLAALPVEGTYEQATRAGAIPKKRDERSLSYRQHWWR